MKIDDILEKKKMDLRFIIALPCVATPLKNIRHKFQFNNSMEALKVPHSSYTQLRQSLNGMLLC